VKAANRALKKCSDDKPRIPKLEKIYFDIPSLLSLSGNQARITKRVNVKFLSTDLLDTGNRVKIIQSCTGTGKTSIAIKHAREQQMPVISVCPLKTQVQEHYKVFSNKENGLPTETIKYDDDLGVHSLGLKWKEAGSEKPTKGTEIKNDPITNENIGSSFDFWNAINFSIYEAFQSSALEEITRIFYSPIANVFLVPLSSNNNNNYNSTNANENANQSEYYFLLKENRQLLRYEDLNNSKNNISEVLSEISKYPVSESVFQKIGCVEFFSAPIGNEIVIQNSEKSVISVNGFDQNGISNGIQAIFNKFKSDLSVIKNFGTDKTMKTEYNNFLLTTEFVDNNTNQLATSIDSFFGDNDYRTLLDALKTFGKNRFVITYDFVVDVFLVKIDPVHFSRLDDDNNLFNANDVFWSGNWFILRKPYSSVSLANGETRNLFFTDRINEDAIINSSLSSGTVWEKFVLLNPKRHNDELYIIPSQYGNGTSYLKYTMPPSNRASPFIETFGITVGFDPCKNYKRAQICKHLVTVFSGGDFYLNSITDTANTQSFFKYNTINFSKEQFYTTKNSVHFLYGYEVRKYYAKSYGINYIKNTLGGTSNVLLRNKVCKINRTMFDKQKNKVVYTEKNNLLVTMQNVQDYCRNEFIKFYKLLDLPVVIQNAIMFGIYDSISKITGDNLWPLKNNWLGVPKDELQGYSANSNFDTFVQEKVNNASDIVDIVSRN
jgi:hypothetical protein